MRPLGTLLSACCLTMVMAGCEGQRGSGPPPDSTAPPPSKDQLAIQHHLNDLADQIDHLEDQLGHGRGAMRDGSSFSVEGGGGDESLLERMRRLQGEVATAHASLAAKDKLIADLRNDLATAKTHGEGLAEQADALSHVRDNLITAQQELADRQTKLAAVQSQLALSELERLKAEKSYYQVAGTLLKLAPGQTQELIDLQEIIRNQVKELRPADTGDKR